MSLCSRCGQEAELPNGIVCHPCALEIALGAARQDVADRDKRIAALVVENEQLRKAQRRLAAKAMRLKMTLAVKKVKEG